MREIKFRAWDKETKQFNWIELTNGETWIDKDWEPLQQFTGLLDKHGKEIYEGDIVLGAVVEWDRTMGMWNIIRRQDESLRDDYKILGNIYDKTI